MISRARLAFNGERLDEQRLIRVAAGSPSHQRRPRRREYCNASETRCSRLHDSSDVAIDQENHPSEYADRVHRRRQNDYRGGEFGYANAYESALSETFYVFLG